MNINQMKESKYLKKEDVGDGLPVMIKKIDHQNVAMDGQEPEFKYVMYFEKMDKGIVLNWTNIQLIAKILGTEETNSWPGKTIVLYNEPNITFGGKLVGGIRVRKYNPAGENF